jgi:hypothetical protein
VEEERHVAAEGVQRHDQNDAHNVALLVGPRVVRQVLVDLRDKTQVTSLRRRDEITPADCC